MKAIARKTKDDKWIAEVIIRGNPVQYPIPTLIDEYYCWNRGLAIDNGYERGF